MKIVVDMDEVLCQFVEKVLQRWNARNGTRFTRDQVNVWRMETVLGRDRDGNDAEGIIDRWLAEEHFFDDLEPHPGAIWGFDHLRGLGHDLVIATSIPEVAVHAFDGKRRWVRRNFPWFSMKNFFSCSRKGWLDGDVLIDDGEHNIRDWTGSCRNGAIVVDAPWNRQVPEMINGCLVRRARDWEEIVAVVGEINAENRATRARAEHGVIG